ncbi:MAG: sulfite exporter TauE/SafE family protein [Methylococcales bacterium]|nr:sulfite exporter TauE/SafE family protein [Methylococcales bacterium]
MNSPNTQTHGMLFKSFIVIMSSLGIVLILWLDRWMVAHAELPELAGEVNVGLLLLMGALTSVHCVGMCGPLVFGYTAKIAGKGQRSYATHLLYGIGKTLSYTIIGGLFGEFGSIVAFTPFSRGVVGILAGVFLVLFGMHMLELFRFLNHFQIRTPGFVMRFIGKEYRRQSNPFVIGLLNGLMIICGPLQAMYVMAAGSGSWENGASILFFFGLGTLPLMLGFGVLTSLISHNVAPRILRFSGVIVIALGVIMMNHGLMVTGTGIDFNTLLVKLSRQFSPRHTADDCCKNEQTINMDVTKTGFEPNSFILYKAVPVKWVIDVKELTLCNKEIVVPAYGLAIKLQAGRQVVEFTPRESGVVPWSCWMGMMPGSFDVRDRPPAGPAPQAAQGGAPPLAQKLEQLLRKAQSLWRSAAEK